MNKDIRDKIVLLGWKLVVGEEFMTKIIQQKDHLILPYKTLRRFVDDKQEINVLDLNDFTNVNVKQDRPRSYHTKVNYYNPEYDEEVKKRERLIGILYKKCSNSIREIESDGKTSCKIREELLKKQIIDFATIEFHRLAIVDDTKLERYRDMQQKRNDEEDERLLKVGMLDKNRCKYSTNYRAKASDIDSFRGYAQNILGTDNEAFINTYNVFDCAVLYIPQGKKYSFWLPPFHFIGNECFLIFIIAPRIALALYPPKVIEDMKKESKVFENLFFAVDGERVEIINSRTLEEVEIMPNGFKELIGTTQDMEQMKLFFDHIRAHAQKEGSSIKMAGLESFIKNEMTLLRTAIILHMLFSKTDKEDLVIETNVFDRDYLKRDKNHNIEQTFKKYGFELRVEKF